MCLMLLGLYVYLYQSNIQTQKNMFHVIVDVTFGRFVEMTITQTHIKPLSHHSVYITSNSLHHICNTGHLFGLRPEYW